MTTQTISTSPFSGQAPGTSGLRKDVRTFQSEHYLANFIQSLFNCLALKEDQTLLLGGDGRYFSAEAIQIILKMAAANGVKKILLGQNGILSTPAASTIIRKYEALGGILLTASHNPGGPNGDFGVKYNISNGGPAPESFTDAVYAETLNITEYLIDDAEDIDITQLGEHLMGNMKIEVIDPIVDYADQMESIFNFEKIKTLIKSNDFSMVFDAMHAVTGPYATEILGNRLGLDKNSILNAIPSPNFAGGHPDPSLTTAKELVAKMFDREQAPNFGAASDGDGDRHMILGDYFFVNPSDSLAILAANANCVPHYKKIGVKGIARSMPTSQAADHVAKKLNIPIYETPTGWKFFGNLLDHDKITFCGEESFGGGANHIREKDGLWAVLFWLNLIAAKHDSVENIVRKHWAEFGRNYYSRHDYEAITLEQGQEVMTHLRDSLPLLAGTQLGELIIDKADDFTYIDPIDSSVSDKQGIRIIFDNGSRIVYRLSGTGTQGATLRIYIERYEADSKKHDLDIQETLKVLIEHALQIARVEQITGRTEASNIV
ncbi:MAG TPA: alpha-D-glucose phosphate-specific phosphoglucomutase [Thiotrichaceae bacterium]|nr:alpha-D-glucose phosphate-specific phosphoglucomutase [Thiotrichaceae bacterium]